MSDAPSPLDAPPAGRDRPPPRSQQLSRFMAMPVLFATALMLATAVLAGLVWWGGSADGDRVTFDLTGRCAADAAPLVEARMGEVGLGDPTLQRVGDDRLRVTATLPGLDDDRAHIPGLLGARGWVDIARGDTVVLDRTAVTEASIRLDEGGAAYAWLDLTREGVEALEAALAADPDGELTIRLDGETAAIRPNTRGIKDDGIRIVSPGEMTPRTRMRIAADTVIRLNHGPLPCGLSAGPVADVAAP